MTSYVDDVKAARNIYLLKPVETARILNPHVDVIVSNGTENKLLLLFIIEDVFLVHILRRTDHKEHPKRLFLWPYRA
ncbi:hypothetical protein MBAV_006157 [Candidatus Magnetobacterium bavaricum]|uniref:Uncharacterized protein n=1 Tax=Candidatus Magnetobacterium bavaricum TaxID=29290 RepID=A0A0F3GI66_9BACT|nr:hypothetical protein MBAV_006157 [Candidatus Magnetobacterium bavaricum]